MYITDIEVKYACTLCDHHPVQCTVTLGELVEREGNMNNESNPRIQWDLSSNNNKPGLGVVYDVTRYAGSNFTNVLRVCKNKQTSLLRIILLVKS